MKKILAGTLMAAIVTLGSAAMAEEEQVMPGVANVTAQFSPEIQELFKKEMVGIQNTMMQLMPAIASGNWAMVDSLAEKMAMSHIMKQKLTLQQMEALHNGMPTAFKVLDNKFHDQSAMLSHVAKQQHPELVTFYYYKLTETCIECHSQFAQKSFPGLIVAPQSHESHGNGHDMHEGEHEQLHEH